MYSIPCAADIYYCIGHIGTDYIIFVLGACTFLFSKQKLIVHQSLLIFYFFIVPVCWVPVTLCLV
jgi:hypothetical protein